MFAALPATIDLLDECSQVLQTLPSFLLQEKELRENKKHSINTNASRETMRVTKDLGGLVLNNQHETKLFIMIS